MTRLDSRTCWICEISFQGPTDASYSCVTPRAGYGPNTVEVEASLFDAQETTQPPPTSHSGGLTLPLNHHESPPPHLGSLQSPSRTPGVDDAFTGIGLSLKTTERLIIQESCKHPRDRKHKVISCLLQAKRRGTESMKQMSISLNSLPHCFAFTYHKTTSVNSGKHIISVFLAMLRFYLLMEAWERKKAPLWTTQAKKQSWF